VPVATASGNLPPAATPVPAFSDIAALVQTLPDEAAPVAAANAPASLSAAAARPAARPPAQQRAQAASPSAAQPTRPSTRPAATARTPRAEPAAPAHPARIWVQIANGARSAFAFQLGRIRREVPELLNGRSVWTAANGASARLLVGPFATQGAALAFVRQLAAEDVEAFTWSSAAGQEVERLPAR
jgi:hypothetical protein